MNNKMTLEFEAQSVNEGFARVAVAAFITPLNPTLEEVSDVETAVSEAVTNAIIHGYEGVEGRVRIEACIEGDILHIAIEDKGTGIDNIEQAMEPLFTTKPELERSGMGFAFMEAFMDELHVDSEPGKGTRVTMAKKLGTLPWLMEETLGDDI